MTSLPSSLFMVRRSVCREIRPCLVVCLLSLVSSSYLPLRSLSSKLPVVHLMLVEVSRCETLRLRLYSAVLGSHATSNARTSRETGRTSSTASPGRDDSVLVRLSILVLQHNISRFLST